MMINKAVCDIDKDERMLCRLYNGAEPVDHKVVEEINIGENTNTIIKPRTYDNPYKKAIITPMAGGVVWVNTGVLSRLNSKFPTRPNINVR